MQIFHCTSDDPRVFDEFALHFKSYIEYELNRTEAGNGIVGDLCWTGSPRLIPLANTILLDEQDLSHNSLLSVAEERLVDFLDDSDDSSDETSGSDGIFAYWKPVSGDISILTRETAVAIANLTDCCFLPESADKRVKLTNGNVQGAQDKLKALEPLMVNCRP